MSQRIIRDILLNTKICRNHLTPELPLRLITSDCPLYHKPIADEAEKIFQNDPFWAFYWPGGQALSRFILDNPNEIREKLILDLGCGCGASAIAALRSGASSALANDIDKVALYAAKLNADLNKINKNSFQINNANLIGSSMVSQNVILLGDLFYDSDFSEILIPWLRHLRNSGKEIFIGDPGRHGLTQRCLQFMTKVATYRLPENCCIENNGFQWVHVWKFE